MRALSLCAILLALIACAPPQRAAPAALPTPASALAGWRELYRRDGWAGGAALDLRAVGDVMLGRLVGTIASQRGLDYPFAQARPLLQGDITIGNLESPLTNRTGLLRPGPYRLPAPPAFAAPLRAAGFDALSLANNHALDVGPQGLADSDAALRSAAVAPLGAGPTADAASAPFITTTAGLRVALFALNDVGDPEDRADEGQSAWGRAWLNDAALDRVRAARPQVDALVVLVHWGHEYDQRPTIRQRNWAAKLVAAGADLIVGAHPHVLQPVEHIASGGRSGLVAYSLGNFLFDQSDRAETSTGAVLRVLLDKNGVALAAAAPVAIVAGQARPLPPESEQGGAALCPLLSPQGGGDLSGTPSQPAERALHIRCGLQPAPSASPAPSAPRSTPAPSAPPVGAAPAPSTPSPPLPSRESGTGEEGAPPRAWRWDGAAARARASLRSDPPLPAWERGLGGEGVLAPRPQRLPVDLRGDGAPLWAGLDASGLVEIRDGPAAAAPVVWRNEAPSWRVTRIDAGDIDGDGRVELFLLLWRPDASGKLGAHPFLVGWRGGRFRVIWGGSATTPPLQDAAIGDLDGDGRHELAVLLGGAQPGDAASSVAIWRWHDWVFEELWRGDASGAKHLSLHDLDGDGRPEIVAAFHEEAAAVHK